MMNLDERIEELGGRMDKYGEPIVNKDQAKQLIRDVLEEVKPKKDKLHQEYAELDYRDAVDEMEAKIKELGL